MNSNLVINGLPDRIRLDGWWLASEAAPNNERPQGRAALKQGPEGGRRGRFSALLLLGLVALAD